MLFSSTTFIFIFLPVVLAAYYLLRGHRKAQNTVLCLFSLFFYAWGEPKFVLVMMLSILVNWFAGLQVHKHRGDKRAAGIVLGADVAFNLVILFIFKYLTFTVSTINELLFAGIPVKDIALPIGISFFTFQAISYVIDVYRERGAAQKNILNVALYISFFPQLIAGPIVRYETIADQIENRVESLDDFSKGVVRFIIGLGKKCILANSFALLADAAWEMSAGTYSWFGMPVELGAGMAWLGAIAYTFQIFFDFSGYSDMAIGLGRMFGFHFLENFNYPYISGSITEFWRRWHISLGTWFRDYLYIPLGGSRCSRGRSYFNLAVVWICTGIWHGANWTFLAWGIMYMILIMGERATGFARKSLAGSLGTAATVAGHIYTMFFVIMGWVVFRSDSIGQAFSFMHSMFSFGTSCPATAFLFRENLAYIIIALIASVPAVPKLKSWCLEKSAAVQLVWQIVSGIFIAVVFVVSVSFIVRGSYNPFIYFNF